MYLIILRDKETNILAESQNRKRFTTYSVHELDNGCEFLYIANSFSNFAH
jgi:hypothetical protein